MERRQLYLEVPYEDSSTPPAILEKLEELGGLGTGWAHCVGFVMPPRRELPLASKQSIRRKRLKARLEKKYPLFADQFYDEALQARPEYYGAANAGGPASPDVPPRPPGENPLLMSAKEGTPAPGHEPRTRACPACGQPPGSLCLAPSGNPLGSSEHPVHHTSRVVGRREGGSPRRASAENPAPTPDAPVPARPSAREQTSDGRPSSQPALF